MVGLIGFGLILPSLAANGEINGLFASRINQWVGALTAQIGNAAPVTTLKARYSCECWQNKVENRKIWYYDLAPVPCAKVSPDDIGMEACNNNLCPKDTWTGGFKCQNYEDPLPLQDKSHQGEYSCLCGNTWITGKTECGKYAPDPYSAGGTETCPPLCAKHGTGWITGGGIKNFEYKVVDCSTAPVVSTPPKVKPVPVPVPSLSETIKKEKAIAYFVRVSSSPIKVGPGGTVNITWKSKNTQKCRVWFELGGKAIEEQRISGSLSFTVSSPYKKPWARYNVRCWTPTEVANGKTSQNDGIYKGRYIRIYAN